MYYNKFREFEKKSAFSNLKKIFANVYFNIMKIYLPKVFIKFTHSNFSNDYKYNNIYINIDVDIDNKM